MDVLILNVQRVFRQLNYPIMDRFCFGFLNVKYVLKNLKKFVYFKHFILRNHHYNLVKNKFLIIIF